MKIAIKSFFRFLSYQYLPWNSFFKKYRARPEPKEPISHSSPRYQDLSRLPDHLVALILENLCTADRARTTLVCKSWKNIITRAHIPQAREAPWLITSNDSYFETESFLTEIQFLSLSEEERIYRFKLPNPFGDIKGGWLCGSSRGWLVIATGPGLNPNMFLWNPISGSIRKLPPLCTLPFLDDFVEDSVVSSFIRRTEVFSVGSTECVVAAIFRIRDSDVLALCTPQDKAWTVFRGEENVRYDDILFHNGILHTLTVIEIYLDVEIENNDVEITIRLTDCEVGLQPIVHYNKIPSDYDEDEDEDLLNPPGFSIISSKRYFIEHLVESSITGELLCARAFHERCSFNSDGGPIKPFTVYQLTEFSICSMKQPSPVLEDMRSLGEQAVFVGTTGSVAVDVKGGSADSIYFATDEASGGVNGGDEIFTVHEQGVFHVQENTMQKTCIKTLEYPLQSKIGWFTPKLL